MTKKHELISKLREQERLASRFALVVGLLMVTGLLGMALLDYAKTREYLGWSDNVDFMKVFLIIWAIAFLVLFGVLIVKSARCGATCPHCKKRLQAISAQITVATGFCGFCGEQVFEQKFKKAE